MRLAGCLASPSKPRAPRTPHHGRPARLAIVQSPPKNLGVVRLDVAGGHSRRERGTLHVGTVDEDLSRLANARKLSHSSLP
eukprot:scaffold8881_cov95-Isochrysis_galbana.AAC.4